MKLAPLGLLCTLGLSPTISHADAEIRIRVSFKIINRRDGSMPQGALNLSVTSVIDRINTLFEQNGSGYRMVLVDPVTRIGGGFDDSRPNPSHYAYRDIVAYPGLRGDMQEDAEANPDLWDWNFEAVNLYVHEATRGLECTRPESEVIVLGDSDANVAQFTLHMLGHFFGLCNSQGCGCNCCGNDDRDCDSAESDGVADTLPDRGCWNENDSARYNFGVNYDDLDVDQRSRVDLAMRNAMGFRGTGFPPCGFGFPSMHLTQGQLDRWADTASTTRLGVCDGRTFFVDASATGSQSGRSATPFDRVAEGVAVADSGGDIVMVRGGVYPESLRIAAPVTLRVPRGQIARIGG